MANISYQNKVFHVLGLLCFLLLIQKNNAFQYPVGGGSKGWTVPDNTCSKSYYNDWANRTRFQIGDSLCKLTFCPKISSFYRTCTKSWYFVSISLTITEVVSSRLLQCLFMILAKTRCFKYASGTMKIAPQRILSQHSINMRLSSHSTIPDLTTSSVETKITVSRMRSWWWSF